MAWLDLKNDMVADVIVNQVLQRPRALLEFRRKVMKTLGRATSPSGFEAPRGQCHASHAQ
ncbi:MAG: hypothetical protein K2X64_05140 [Rhodocyclaceae bacterium]|nr:hypothetical protein [Rhodocyclaceae bacterium]